MVSPIFYAELFLAKIIDNALKMTNHHGDFVISGPPWDGTLFMEVS